MNVSTNLREWAAVAVAVLLATAKVWILLRVCYSDYAGQRACERRLTTSRVRCHAPHTGQGRGARALRKV